MKGNPIKKLSSKARQTIDTIDAEEHRFQERALEVLQSSCFDLFMTSVIILNAITIGIGQMLEIQGASTLWVNLLETIFLVVYLAEFVFRVWLSPSQFKEDRWVQFDGILVVSGVLFSWIIEPFFSPSDSRAQGMLKVVRLARLFKMIRFMAKNRDFWTMCRGVSRTLGVLSYFGIIIVMMVYFLGCMAVELITKHPLNIGAESDPAFQEHVSFYFGSLPQAIVTLMQFVSQDDMQSVYGPLVHKDPALMGFFVGLMIPFSISITNILGAVVVISLWGQFDSDRKEKELFNEMKWQRVLSALHNIFTCLNVDGTGNLSLPEFMGIERDQALDIRGEINCADHDVEDVFRYIDEDKNGFVSIDEFCGAVLLQLTRAVEKEHPAEAERMRKEMGIIQQRLKDLSHQSLVQGTLAGIENLVLNVLQGDVIPPWGTQLIDSAKLNSHDTGKSPALQQNMPIWANDLTNELKTSLEDIKRHARPGAAFTTDVCSTPVCRAVSPATITAKAGAAFASAAPATITAKASGAQPPLPTLRQPFRSPSPRPSPRCHKWDKLVGKLEQLVVPEKDASRWEQLTPKLRSLSLHACPRSRTGGYVEVEDDLPEGRSDVLAAQPFASASTDLSLVDSNFGCASPRAPSPPKASQIRSFGEFVGQDGIM